MDVPTFGEKQANVNYKTRYAAYIVISNEEKNQIILAQAPNGAYFLPGGEIEKGEDHKKAIHRETLEELGFEVEIGRYFGEADEYFHSNHRQTDFYNPGYFYEAIAWQKVCEPLEADSRSAWFPPTEAIEKLKRGSHKWAVKEWLKEK